jgi:hypothetical protein
MESNFESRWNSLPRKKRKTILRAAFPGMAEHWFTRMSQEVNFENFMEPVKDMLNKVMDKRTDS